MMRQYELVERVQRYKPDVNEALLNKAYVYAMQKHGHQRRASGDPYFSHPLEVAAILTDMHLDEATIAVALLHDTIEDTTATRQEIDELFGPEIGKLVEGLTKLKKLDLVSKKAEQAENLRKLLLAISEDVRVLLVKLADRLHNMRTLDHVPPDKRLRIAEETMEIYAPLAGRMGMQDMREELEELAFRYINPDAHRTVTERLAEVFERSKGVIGEIEKAISALFEKHGIKATVKSRQKKPWSVFRKMETKALSFEQLSDIFGFRVVVDTVEDCYRALGAIHTTWSMVPGRFKDYISTPKQNDYRSIHTTIVGPSSQRVELQIRTREMNTVAEYGVAAHSIYKDNAGKTERHRPPDLQGDQRLCLAAPHHRAAGRGRQPGGVPREHQARAVPGPGLLLHAEGPADRAAARRDADRLRLCRAHRCRRPVRRRQGQRPHHAADDRAEERRRGRDHPLQGAGAAGRVGIDRRHRQGARRHPPRHQERHPQAVFGARRAHPRARLRAHRQGLSPRTA